MTVGAAVAAVAIAAPVLIVLSGRHGHREALRRPPSTIPVTAFTVEPTVLGSSEPQSPATTATATTPTGTRLVDLTWISDSRGWALVSVPCPAWTCAAILFTTDGGHSWTRSPALPDVSGNQSSRGCVSAGCFEHLRFASRTVGYLWGQAVGLFMTLDGGQSWIQQSSNRLLALEPTADWVIRVTAPRGLGDTLEVDRAAVGSSQWTEVPTDVGSFGGEIFTAGRSLYIAWPSHTAGGAPDAHTRFVRSRDGGTTWSSFVDPCGHASDGTELDASVFAATTNGDLAVLCEPRGATGTLWFTISADSGDTFGPLQPIPINAQAAVQLALANDGRVALVAAAGTASVPSQVVSSTDGGRTWASTLSTPPAAPDGSSPWFGFEDSTTGRVSFGGYSFWTTTDAGRTWTAQQIPSPS
jgi:photosystem II stability/assembly factor-like uncharacterized protein